MASFIKGKLKAARDAIGRKDYKTAQESAAEVLEYEASNYNALVFLGLASLELGDVTRSEEAYKKATELYPDQLLAWQGLSKFYERAGKWSEYGKILRRLIDLLSQQEDATRCAEALQKFIELQRSRGSRKDVIDALTLLLPTSPLYRTLSMLPEPEPTAPTSTTIYGIQTAVYNSLPILEEVVSLMERNEDEQIKKEVDKRRMRLGAGRPEQIQKDVSREVWEKSNLPALYDEILNHPNTGDELRRSTESKLLRQKMQHLEALPNSGAEGKLKQQVLSEVEKLCNGAILLGFQDEVPWMFIIDNKDAYDIEDYDIRTLRRFIEVFPGSTQTKLIRGYFDYMGIPVVVEDEDGENDQESPEDSVDPFAIVLEAASELPKSILAHRIVAELYQIENDYENAIKTAEAGLFIIRSAEINYGKSLPRVTRAFNVVLAVALVKMFPPKHHQRADELVSSVLSEDPDNIPCLMGRGYILQHKHHWIDAVVIFKRVISLDPNHDDLLEAEEQWAWSIIQAGRIDDGISELRNIIQKLDEEDEKEEQKARAWWRLGKALWDSGDDVKESAYKHFITALKRCSTFAPAFTSLGVYYADFASPPDLDRSSKCFQKAFELDAREAEAARRLAGGFAEEREWDLVEVVARRTIEGEGGLEGGSAGMSQQISTRYLPVNAWAWKAVGIVELNRRNYPAATQAFQVALRADDNDFLSWQRLGEAYTKSGRHAAAIKALKRALELQPEDWMSLYLLGEVYRVMGQYGSAVEVFEDVRAQQPDEICVSMALSDTHLEEARTQLAEGFRSRAESSAISAVLIASELIKKSAGFRRVTWKIAADAAYELSRFTAFDDPDSVYEALITLTSLIGAYDSGSSVEGIVQLPFSKNSGSLDGNFALEVAIAAYDYRISLDKLDDIAGGSALFDLGVALSNLSSRTSDKGKANLATTQAKDLLLKALATDPYNDVYWNTFGTLNFVENPKMAQHAYIKALECDAKNPATWTNLGLLSLYHDDNELANECLYRAQTLDPDYILAWVGQGLVATKNGHHVESHALFAHAIGISADVPAADLEFSTRAFKRLVDPANTSSSREDLLPVFHALDRYCKQRPNDAAALHLFALTCESAQQTHLALELVTRSIRVLERAYEESEDTQTEENFALANGTLGRLRLATNDYIGALEAFSTTLSLLPAETESSRIKIMRSLAQFGSGIANFRLGELEAALEVFETCLAEVPDDMSTVRGHVTVFLAQTLWALGSPEAQETARGQLLECISTDPENLTAMSALVAIGILESDDSLVDAALSEIQGLTLDKRAELDPGRIVTRLLIQNHLARGRAKEALSEAQRAVYREPVDDTSRKALTSLLLQQGHAGAAGAIIEGNRNAPRETLDVSLRLSAIATCERNPDIATQQAQKSVLLAPWKSDNWKALVYVRCTNA
ncbi:hypothetical protein M422DRAFT_32689 [Sphaerobolus stellatus SS14]|uniref:Superkiller protein 3 n=1 Tax=Sphaerobolus stellatus (strain SS14) TaxID=990650 RepID=A0A0C9VN76_SPHS4|nr:hypothetical protein M422DRAFT_32689 [Sphaerobolus stellatus SS14]